jgi:hypothetical protein
MQRIETENSQRSSHAADGHRLMFSISRAPFLMVDSWGQGIVSARGLTPEVSRRKLLQSNGVAASQLIMRDVRVPACSYENRRVHFALALLAPIIADATQGKRTTPVGPSSV